MQSVRVKQPRSVALATVCPLPTYDLGWSEKLKRAFDIAVSVLALIASVPLLLVACVLIAIDTGASPIYVQKRMGRHGKVFHIYKLRTMVPNTESYSFTTQDNDWRVTALGAILRKTKVDELPQLVNIIKGEMSIIGPRPLSVVESRYIVQRGFTRRYPGFIPAVKPGLIGLEQLNRGKPMDYGERFSLNYEYERNCSTLLDWQILLRSVPVCRYVCLATVCAGLCELVMMLSMRV